MSLPRRMGITDEIIDNFELMKKWIVVHIDKPKYCIITTTKLFDTIFYMQSLWYHLADIQEDDIWDKDMWRIEQNILYYYR